MTIFLTILYTLPALLGEEPTIIIAKSLYLKNRFTNEW